MKIVLHISVEFALVILVVSTRAHAQHVLRVVLAAVLKQVTALALRTVGAHPNILMLELIVLKLIDEVLRVDRVIV